MCCKPVEPEFRLHLETVAISTQTRMTAPNTAMMIRLLETCMRRQRKAQATGRVPFATRKPTWPAAPCSEPSLDRSVLCATPCSNFVARATFVRDGFG